MNPQMRSPWLAMNAQPDPMQQQMAQDPAMQQQMLFAQMQVPEAQQEMAQSVRDALKLNPQSPKPIVPPAQAYPGFENVITDKIRKIRSR